MTKSLLCLILILNLSAITLAQGAKRPRPDNDIRLSELHPTVYITFERAGKRKPMHVDESDQGLWFRLHNNTRWPISLRMSSDDNAEAYLYYEVEAVKEDTEAPRTYGCQVCSVNLISPGRSVGFSLPREHFTKGLAIRIEFNYGWELEKGSVFERTDEPKHYVYFYHSDLPKSIQ